MHSEKTEEIKRSLNSALERALKGGVVASMVVIRTEGLSGRTVSMTDLEGLVRASLRRRADFVITSGNAIFIILHETEKDEAVIVAERIRHIIIDYITTKESGNSTEINYTVASSSEGEDSFDAIIADMER